jgi:N-methylhydantoinase A/oxoprolinase/acetone carboxylase beta subunit
VWTVDIDVGGTLTDGLFSGGGRMVSVKVDTTPHDLTVCLFDCLGQGAAKLDFPDTSTFLENVDLIRWSTTITSNVLAERRGPRIGLLVTEQHENDLYGSAQQSAALHRLLTASDVIGVNGSATEGTIMNVARLLLERGVRRICISLEGAHHHPEREIAWKRVIDQQYPDHFLGSVPVLAGGEISKNSDDFTRATCAVINAYTHGALAATLFKAEDDLRQASQYSGTFLVSHINGGVAGVAKTKAIDTLESGPVLGVLASAHLAKAYGLEDVVAMDIGGTTAKVSVLAQGEPIYRKPAELFGIPVELSLPYLRSIALGGGSLVKPKSPAVQLGPESMGSYPGPACYGLGGDQPTLTDAFVTAGLINPDYFLGGTKAIDRELAEKMIEEAVAKPLHLEVEQACQAIIGRAFAMVAEMIGHARSELHRDFAKHTLFAYGGNGGLFACDVAERAGLQSVYVFSLGPVFSAFGSSVSDISHVYERALRNPTISKESLAQLRGMLEEMKEEAIQDLLGEGIRPENMSYALEFEVSRRDRHSAPVACQESALRSVEDLGQAIASASGTPSSAVSIDLFRLRVKKEMVKPRLAEKSQAGADPSSARLGKRRVFWGSRHGEAEIYRWESLGPGQPIRGCAVLEGESTTYFVPEGWTLTVDGYGNAQLTRN